MRTKQNTLARLGIFGGLVAVALPAFEATAHASTSTTISQSTTISGTPATSWSSAGTKIGDFGAGYTATQSVSSDVSGANKAATAENAVIIELFGSKMTLGDTWGKAMSGVSNSATQAYKVTVAGVNWLNVASSALSASEVDFEKCTESGTISSEIMVGPVPITVEGGVDLCAGVGLYGSATFNSSSSQLSGTVKPYGTNALGVSVGVGSSDFSVGVEASVALLDLGIPITNTVNITPSTGNLNYSISGKLTLDTLDGSFALYAKALFIKYTYTLFSWSGISLADVVLFSDSIPVVSNVTATVYGNKATGGYTFADSAGLNDKSVYEWSRSYNASDSSATVIGNTKDWSLVDADNTAYLKLCVTPYNGANYGTKQCSPWAHVMHLAQFYKDSNYGNTELVIAYQMERAGTCINLTDYSFNDVMSSYQIHGAANYSTMVVFYKDIDCTGTSYTQTVGANTTATQSDMRNVGLNDAVTSFKVSWNDAISVSDVSVSISGSTANGVYTLDDANDMPESGSVYTWKRASDANGTGATTIATGSSTYTLTTSDNAQYLQFCITPSDGLATAAQTCSSWAYVGHLVEMWKDMSFGGTNLNFAYEKTLSGHCFNLTDYSFNDAMTSYAWSTGSSGTTLTFYSNVDCAGSSTTSSLGANASTSNSNVGSSWNDQVSSFKVGSVTSVDQSLSMNGTCYSPGSTLMQNSYDTLVFQGDGNLVLYQTDGISSSAVWNSSTSGKSATSVCLQTDGNMVIYGGSSALWASGTSGNSGATLKLQSDCNLVLYSSSGASKWATGTNPC